MIAVDHERALATREAFRVYGKGRQPAGLNFGDRFAYALARMTGDSLLFKGAAIAVTDITRAQLKDAAVGPGASPATVSPQVG